jgi:hypothetical protein
LASAGLASPRGRVEIDPQMPNIDQIVYIRKVEKVGNKRENVELATSQSRVSMYRRYTRRPTRPRT